MAAGHGPNLRWVVRLLVAVVVVIGFVVIVSTSGDDDGHRLTATVGEATNLLEGQELKAGGGKIGVIDELVAIDEGRKARITLSVEDRAWPLREGTTFSVRFGGTASFYNRHILVKPGPADAPALPEGGTIPAKDFNVPVEVDQLLGAFNPGVRRDVKSFINRSGRSFGLSRAPFARVLDDAPGAVQQGAAVMADVTDDRGTLDAVLRRTDRVVDAVRRADPDLSSLLTGAAQTFDAIGDEQRNLGTTLDRMPAMLSQAQSTLRHADSTLVDVGSLARRIAPGVRELRATAQPLDRVLGAVQDIAPEARGTLRTVRRSAPAIDRLLDHATLLSPQLESIGDQSVDNLQCIRPWTPEIMGLLTTWADFMSWSDGKDKYLRAALQSFLPANYNDVPYSPADASKAFSGLRYGFPRPPGYNAGQPWLQPQCGAGADALDPSKDQEARSPAGTIPTLRGAR